MTASGHNPPPSTTTTRRHTKTTREEATVPNPTNDNDDNDAIRDRYEQVANDFIPFTGNRSNRTTIKAVTTTITAATRPTTTTIR